MQKLPRLFLHLILLAVILAACAPSASPSPTADISSALTQAFGTAFAQLQPTNTPLPTETPIPSPTAVRTPPALPSTFVAGELNPLDTPHTYVQDTCQYLYNKWNSNNAAPGTVVMVVMFHHIVKGTQTASDALSIGSGDFKQLMNDIHKMGFEAINTTQLADFLYTNAKIPPRSVLL